jgi:pimeloyl-ACP methyl ester carboxylesterase
MFGISIFSGLPRLISYFNKDQVYKENSINQQPLHLAKWTLASLGHHGINCLSRPQQANRPFGRYHYGYVKVAPQPGKPTLLLLHGYPSSSFGWHHQVKQSISAGYGVIAPDFLGYGDTSAPTDIAAYDHTKIAKQIVEILDVEKISTVIAIGHDWGAGFLSTFARMFAKRISLLIFICVGYGNSHEMMTDMTGLGARN